MSFKAELEALIANATSSLDEFELVLRRAQSGERNGDGVNDGDGCGGEIQAQFDRAHQKILSSLLRIRESYNHDQERISDLERDLKLDFENVRQCAIDDFIKGEYLQCERLLSFLTKVLPHDEDLLAFLELSRRKQLESETEKRRCAAQSQPRPGASHQEEPLSNQNRDGAITSPDPRRGEHVECPQPAAREMTSPLWVADVAGLRPDFQPASQDQADTIESQTLALPASAKPGIRMWVVTVSLGVAATLYWLSRTQPEIANLESLPGSQSRVEEQISPADPLEAVRRKAQELFDAGKLQEAGGVCEEILSKFPQDIFAVSLKGTIQVALAKPKAPEDDAVPSERDDRGHTPSGDESSGTQAVAAHNRNRLAPSALNLKTALSGQQATLNAKRIDGPIQAAGGQSPGGEQRATAKRAVPVLASAARRLSTGRVETVPPISPDQLREVNGRIQAKEFDQARLLLEQLRGKFPTDPEVRALAERLRLEAGKQESLTLSWIQRAEAAWVAGRYVTPPDDNVLVYCNLALKVDPKNQRAANLKREIVQRAVAQAQDWIQRGKFDWARQSYASMDHFAASDDAFPYPKSDLKRELEKLDFTAYSIVHDHKLGSCSGLLKFNAYAISYVPSRGSDDGFVESFDSIVLNPEGERLKIRCRDKTFRFRSENENTVQAIYQDLIARMTDEKSVLATRSPAAP